jgi:N-carbamoylputrescine amidase
MERRDKFNIALVQMSASVSGNDNLDRATYLIGKAAANGAQVVCLPELFRSQYFCQKEDAALFDLAETIPGPSTESLSVTAKRLGVAIIAPLFDRRAA